MKSFNTDGNDQVLKELTYAQRLEILCYLNNGNKYKKLLDITGYLKSDAFDICKNLGKNKKCKKVAEVKPIDSPVEENNEFRLWNRIHYETRPKLLKSNKMLQNFLAFQLLFFLLKSEACALQSLRKSSNLNITIASFL